MAVFVVCIVFGAPLKVRLNSTVAYGGKAIVDVRFSRVFAGLKPRNTIADYACQRLRDARGLEG
jgi:hypothetical protein